MQLFQERNPVHLGWPLLVSLLGHSTLLLSAHLLTLDINLRGPLEAEVELVPHDEARRAVEEARAEAEAAKALPVETPERSEAKKEEARERPEAVKQPRKQERLRLASAAPEPKKEAEPKPKPEPKAEEKKPPEPEPKAEEKAIVLERLPEMKAVEVQNAESKEAPKNAHFLSDKNRIVEHETRAVHTNLEKDSKRPEPFSSPGGDSKEKEPGAKETKIAETREQKDRAGAKKGQEKPSDADGEKPVKVSPLLVMRVPPGVAGPGEPSPEVPRELSPDGFFERKPRGGGGAGEPSPARRHLDHDRRLDLDNAAHDRIYGQEGVRQRELARLSPSTRSGRFEKKWSRMRAALENFIPEVQPGNQTALGTRAHPFALYIAQMHRKIHKLWGFGFLTDLDLKSDSNPMNDMTLWTLVEVVLKPDGTVDKATIARTSGVLTYDVASLDAVFTGGPYPPTPREIRSADGKVYLHWRFHRDQRQCGTFGVDPFILTTPPKGPIDTTAREVGKGRSGNGLTEGSPVPSAPKMRRRAPAPAPAPSRGGGGDGDGEGSGTEGGSTGARPSSSRAPARSVEMARPDAASRQAASRFVQGFASGDARAMAAACAVPFSSRGTTVAKTRAELERILGDLVREAKKRTHSPLSLMTLMEARDRIGRLPGGVEYGEKALVGRVDLGGAPTILVLKPGGRDGWQVVGLER
jgi:chemotaxis protein histidine kinase CheA